MEKSENKTYNIARLLICLVFILIVIILALFAFLGKDKTTLSITAPDFTKSRSSLSTTLKSYSAEPSVELLYQKDGMSTISGSNIDFEWSIPDEFKNRDTYVELHIKDEEVDKTYISCAYYVSNNSKGILANIFRWNKLSEGQKVGCVDEGSKYSSFTEARRNVESTLSSLDISSEMIGRTEVENIVNSLLKNKTATINNYYTNSGIVGQTGPQGPRGEKGDKGDQGEAGDRGEKGDQGEAGRDGQDGTNGVDGIDGQDGINGQDGANGRDGVDGSDGEDGKSAYEIWLDLGNIGTEQDFINSLKGEKGDQGDQSSGSNINVIGGGLVYDGVNLSLSPCAENQVLKATASNIYACSDIIDRDTTYTAGLGLSLSANNAFNIDISDCTAEGGNKITFDSTKGGFVCAADLVGGSTSDPHTLSWDTGTRTISINNTNGTVNSISIGADQNTTYNANNDLGIVLNGNNFGLITCQDGEILKFSTHNGPGEWNCSSDQNNNYDLSGYLQIANLESAVASLAGPGYYNKDEINNLLTSVGSGLMVPTVINNESDLPTDLSTYPAGYQWHIESMAAPYEIHTGRAWVYEDNNGNKQIYKAIDQYLSPDTTSIIKNGSGQLTVSTAWLASNLSGYVDKSTIPTCSNNQFISYNGASFNCANDKDTITANTTYSAGVGLLIDPSQNNAFSINSGTCKGSANKLVFDQTNGFGCETDEVNNQLSVQSLTYNSGAGTISISGGNTITLAQYTAGNGLRLDGKEFSINLPSACSQTQKLTWTGTNFQCAEDMTVPSEVCYNSGDIKYVNRTDSNFTDAFSGELWYKLDGQIISSEVIGVNNSVISKTIGQLNYPDPFVLDSNYAQKGYEITQQHPEYSGYPAWRIFDGTSGTTSGYYDSNTSNSWWVQIKYPTPRKLDSYSLNGARYQAFHAFYGWNILGSNDGSDWDIVDSRTAEVNSSPTPKNAGPFTVPNPSSYKYYRLHVIDSHPNHGLGQWDMQFDISADPNPYGYTLPNQPRNTDGEYPYMKISGECYNAKEYELKEGSKSGYALMWDGDNWVESGALSLDTLTISDTLTIQKIRDSEGNLGSEGQVLKSGADGRVYWRD